jgi:hypothetical protein
MTNPQSPRPQFGPRFHVYIKYSELYADGSPDRFWGTLRQAPVTDTIQALAWISARLASNRDPEVHQWLLREFLEPDVAAELERCAPEPPAVASVFHRLGNLGLIRSLALYGVDDDPAREVPRTLLGTLGLLQNDFVGRDPDMSVPEPGTHRNLDWHLGHL